MNNTTNWPEDLLALFDDPLLDGVKPKPAAMTADDRMQKKIDELRDWIEQNGREPQLTSRNIQEKLKAKSLETIKNMGLWN